MLALTESEARWLMRDLCEKFGFCLHPLDADQLELELCAEPAVDTRTFVDAVFASDGVDPALPSNRSLYRTVLEFVDDSFQRAAERRHVDADGREMQ